MRPSPSGNEAISPANWAGNDRLKGVFAIDDFVEYRTIIHEVDLAVDSAGEGAIS